MKRYGEDWTRVYTLSPIDAMCFAQSYGCAHGCGEATAHLIEAIQILSENAPKSDYREAFMDGIELGIAVLAVRAAHEGRRALLLANGQTRVGDDIPRS